MKIRELHEGLFDTSKTSTPTPTIKKTKNQFGFNINDLTDKQKQQLIDYITHLENPQISTVEPVKAQPNPQAGEQPAPTDSTGPQAGEQPGTQGGPAFPPDLSGYTVEELQQLKQLVQQSLQAA